MVSVEQDLAINLAYIRGVIARQQAGWSSATPRRTSAAPRRKPLPEMNHAG